MKKLLALVIGCVLLFNSVSYAYADSGVVNDIYASNFEETVIIGEESFTYRYSYGTNGDRIINVVNNDTKKEDVVRKDLKSGQVTLNGEIAVTGTEEISYDYSQNSGISICANYEYIGYRNKTISYGESVAVGTFVALVAAAIDVLMSATGVITQMGVATANLIIARGTKAYVTASIYEWVAGSVTTYKFIWRVKDGTNVTHGPYTSYVGV